MVIDIENLQDIEGPCAVPAPSSSQQNPPSNQYEQNFPSLNKLDLEQEAMDHVG